MTVVDPVTAAARVDFGLDYLYPYQRLVIANVLDAEPEGAFQIVVLPTGSGKTLCFTLPALLVPGVTLIVYPLLALMDDQLRRLTEAGVPARLLRGGQSRAEREEVLEAAASGKVRCLLANPETLQDERVRARLAEARISHLVIDEAHCVSEWGETFRPAYLKLGETIRAIGPDVTTAFTATASPTVLAAVQRILFGSRPARLVRGDPDRPNISYSAIRTDSREATLARLVATMPGPTIVFCRSRKRAEAVARDLAAVVGFPRCGAYHAGLDSGERAAIESWFYRSTDGVLAATCAYGLGVDKPDVRSVIHYDVPASVEAFLQESGRAGRDGAQAHSVILWTESVRARSPDSARAAREQIMVDYLRCEGCRRAYLAIAMGAEPPACFGCDSCTPWELPPAVHEARTDAAGARERALRWLRRRRRRFTPDQLVLRLPVAWEQTARQELVGSLLQTGAIRRIRHGPWRGTTTPGRRPRGGTVI